MYLRERELPTKLFFFLFSFMPFYVITIYIIGQVFNFSINNPVFILIKMWKDVFAFLLILVSAFYYWKFARFNALDFFITLFVLSAALYVILAQSVLLALWSFRSLFFIYFFYLLGRLQIISEQTLFKLLLTIYVISFFTAIFGIIQVNFLGKSFYDFVYGFENVNYTFYSFGYDKLRATSTFVSAHEFGLFLSNNLLCVPFLLKYKSKFHINLSKGFILFIAAALVIALFYSFSRSSMIILAICYLLFVLRDSKYLIYYFVLILFGYWILSYIGGLENISLLFGGYDPSTSGHMDIIKDAYDTFSQNIFGIGLGEAGVIIRRFLSNAPQFEGDFFNIIVQMGISGLFFYLITYFISF